MAGSRVRVLHGDCLRVMRLMAALGIQVDAIVSDPPYHLHSIVKRFGSADSAPAKDRDGLYKRASRGFMGQQWDGGDIAMDPATWELALSVLKPGGHMIALCGTRTEHRVACAIEDAGFDIRDRVLWLYATGFPKSHDVSKSIDKMAGAEREVVGAKRSGIGRNVRHGGELVGGECDEVEKQTPVTEPATEAARQWEGWGSALKPAVEIGVLARKPLSEKSIAANVLEHGTGALNIDACRIATDEVITATRNVALGSSSGGIYGSANKPGVYQQSTSGRWPANVIHDGSEEVTAGFPAEYGGGRKAQFGSDTGGIWSKSTGKPAGDIYGDTGSAARYFYSAKADKNDRCGSSHPTVKPVDLIAYLARLITPPGGLILDPFAGSGTLASAALREGFRAILIEREAEYIQDIRRRIKHASGEDAPLFSEVSR